MQSISLLAFIGAASVVSAGWESKTGSCNTGQLSCCDTSKKVDESTGEESGLLHTGDILGQVALQCTQVPILAIAIEDECKNTPVCCEGSKNDGLIGLGCDLFNSFTDHEQFVCRKLKNCLIYSENLRKMEQYYISA